MRGRGELWIRYVPEAKEYMRNKKKDENRYVPEVKKYMRKQKKDEIGMCQKQRNTCEIRKKME